jgi:hypothetical protein
VCMSRVEAVAAVRRKAKDDVASREMLPMLDATPLLVVMPNDGGEEVTAAALYTPLNLGVGNEPVTREFFLCTHVLPFLCFVISISDRSLLVSDSVRCLPPCTIPRNKVVNMHDGTMHKMLCIKEGGASATLTEVVVANFQLPLPQCARCEQVRHRHVRRRALPRERVTGQVLHRAGVPRHAARS